MTWKRRPGDWGFGRPLSEEISSGKYLQGNVDCFCSCGEQGGESGDGRRLQAGDTRTSRSSCNFLIKKGGQIPPLALY